MRYFTIKILSALEQPHFDDLIPIWAQLESVDRWVGLPPGLWPFSFWTGFAFYAVKILIVCAGVSMLEVSMAKMRLFRAVDYLLFGFLISAVAFVLAVSGL